MQNSALPHRRPTLEYGNRAIKANQKVLCGPTVPSYEDGFNNSACDSGNLLEPGSSADAVAFAEIGALHRHGLEARGRVQAR